MATEAEIRAKYKALHDTLTDAYYSGTSGLTKEEFDQQHGKIWDDMEAELRAGGFIAEPEPPRDLVAEIDTLKLQVGKLEKK